MMRRRAAVAAAMAALGAALGAALLLLAAGPVAADNTGVFSEPDPGAPPGPITAPPPRIAGSFHVDVPACFSAVDIVLEPANRPALPAHRVDIPPDGQPTTDIAFVWDHPAFPVNGAYHITATPQSTLCVNPQTTIGPNPLSGTSEDVVLAVPPSRPTGVEAQTPFAGRATVVWAPNPEPDRLGYSIYRVPKKGDGCPAPTDANKVGESTRTSYTDVLKPNDPSGDLCYFVQAVRKGATDKDAVASALSDPATVGVASPSTITGNTTPPSVPSKFPKLTGGKSTGRSNSVGSEPDTGYRSKLPFGATTPTLSAEDQTELGTGEADADQPKVPATPSHQGIHSSDKTVQVRTLGTFAGGLVAAVVLGHLLLLRREVNRTPPLEALPTYSD
jgi:hypothetical protein